MKRKFWLKAPLFLAMIALFVFLAGLIVMSLWNALIPSLFNGPQLSYWQAVGLLVLSKILFGGIGRRGGWRHRQHRADWRRHLENRMASMTPEERERFRSRWERHCGWHCDEETTQEKPAL